MSLKPESLVSPVSSLLGVSTPDGRNVPVERLGPGIVRDVNSEGEVLVHWIEADADALMDPADLQPLDPAAHVVTITKLNAQGVKLHTHNRVITSPGMGIEHNWAVELRPRGVVRALRSDGFVWTFEWNPLLGRMNLLHNADYPPPRNDDSEALTVADLAVS